MNETWIKIACILKNTNIKRYKFKCFRNIFLGSSKKYLLLPILKMIMTVKNFLLIKLIIIKKMNSYLHLKLECQRNFNIIYIII